MKKVILFGANGNLGKEIARELIRQGFELTVVVRTEAKAKSLMDICTNFVIADACHPATLQSIMDRQEIVVSALGKSLSLNDRSRTTFQEVDFQANRNILKEAIQVGARKFVYVSAFHSERYLHLDYFRVHHDFSELLKKSGIDYSIIKPPAIFSAFLEVIELAKKGMLVNLGSGDKLTNPIFEGDLAKIVVGSIPQSKSTIEAGGIIKYTRRQLNEIIQNQMNPAKKLQTVPVWLAKLSLPLIRIGNKNTYDKLAFFIEVIQNDTVAPSVGTMSFEYYVKSKTANSGSKYAALSVGQESLEV